MSDTLIRAAFETRLASWASTRSPVLPVAYEDVSFEPPSDGSAYLKAFLMPASTGSEDLAGAHSVFLGVFQVSIVTQAGQGRGIASRIADELRELFPNNLGLQSGGLTVYVRTPLATAPSLAGDTTTTLPTSFQYRADTI
ncbi:phage tail terminator-like protein [Pseudomonas asplenii]|uniref:phage tail terminator-like protein n=1 Tax=Pseudomonas asplenii TaxID=53407 RepID=UPI0006B3FA58|nr:phage tail terminator-like protein [Pseudomonas fuscovaginae]